MVNSPAFSKVCPAATRAAKDFEREAMSAALKRSSENPNSGDSKRSDMTLAKPCMIGSQNSIDEGS